MRRRLIVALVIGITSALLCYGYQRVFERGGGDIAWPLCSAQALLAGSDPYVCPHVMTNGQPAPTNPLTTVVLMLPLAALSASVAAGVFVGISSALLAFGLTRQHQWWRLLVFLSAPYWLALQTVQWSPLLFAVALLPHLLPIALAKPHIGLPIILTRLTARRAVACVAFGLATLLLDPDWPWRWLDQISSYDGFVPLLTVPGMLVLLALIRWRDERARLLVLLAIVPQRMFYDQLLVWLVASTPRHMLMLTCLSWLGYLGAFLTGYAPHLWIVACIYLPAVALIVLERRPWLMGSATVQHT